MSNIFYLCHQQKFQWKVKVATEELQSQIVPRLRQLSKQPKYERQTNM